MAEADGAIYDWTPGFLGKQAEAEAWKCECDECGCSGDPFSCSDKPVCNCCDCPIESQIRIEAESKMLVGLLRELRAACDGVGSGVDDVTVALKTGKQPKWGMLSEYSARLDTVERKVDALLACAEPAAPARGA